MNGLTLYDGHAHLFLPVEGACRVDVERAVFGLSSPMLARIMKVGQEPEPNVNTAPAIRAIRAEIERREQNQTYFAPRETGDHWSGAPLTNYGRVV